MNLLNRIVEFPDRFDLTIEDTSQKIQVDIFKDEQGDGDEGTVLNAENLTAAFEEKQDALIFGNGIDKNSSNRLTLVKNELICDYTRLAQDLIPFDACDSQLDKAHWTSCPAYPDSFDWGAHYLNHVGEAGKKYSSFDLSFEVRDIHCDLNRDSDPTVAVCLNDDDGEKTIFILFGFVHGRIRVIASSDWMNIFMAENISYPAQNGEYENMKLRVLRCNGENGTQHYSVFINDELKMAFDSLETITDCSDISIGTIGCKATFTDWKLVGSN